MAHLLLVVDGNMQNFSLAEEILGYQTSTDPSNTEKRLLVGGSKNVLIDFQKKTKIRTGYTRLGAANTANTGIRNAWTWLTSTGTRLPQRFYDDELEVYLGTIDTVVLNAWYRVRDTWSTTQRLRQATWFDTGENLDLQIMVNGDDNLYAWNGAVAVVQSASGTTILKRGTNTWAQNRFFTTGNKTLINPRTGNTHTYTGGETTTTLTGLNNITGIQVGDVLFQQIITTSNSPAADRNNHYIHSHLNQIYIGSNDDEEVQISRTSSYTDFTYDATRLSGQGGLLTLDDPTRGFASLEGIILVFSGRNSIYTARHTQIAVSTTLAETLDTQKVFTGVDQGALNQETIIPLGNAIAYLTNEVTLRIIQNPQELEGINPKTFSNPIKLDFDAETWFDSDNISDAFGFWYKNVIFITAPQSSRLYMLNFVEDADGKLFRYWNPPQILPVRALSVIDSGDGDKLHGHSNAIPETYLLFDGASDGQYSGMPTADKIPIDAKAIFAYDGDKANLNTFDEYYADGEITPATENLNLQLNYDIDGTTQKLEKTINGSDEDILEGSVGFNSLAQQSLAVNPLGGLLNPPSDARKFRVIFDIAREDFHQMQAIFSTNDIDKYWAITAHGSNATKSPRRNLLIHK